MTDFAIRVTHLSKSYRVGVREEKPRTLIGRMANLIQQPIQNLRRLRRLATYDDKTDEADDLIWALRDVSLEIQRGEVVGIIGHNGAGKSTLLKILSRITYPTSGYAEIVGRISSLLEVGTGFHQELTGRENVYMNGTLLGMTRSEINRKFDEIVDFSGVEKFIDTPVKHYSSGMKVRLAFSVAAHLEPEILLVDEVLAVGDAEFQKKCLGKLSTVADSGRTVLFVSHNMAAMQNLCNRGIWLDHGTVCQVGGMTEVAESYLRRTQLQPQGQYLDLSQHAGRRANSLALIKGVQLRNSRTGENVIYPDDPLDVLIWITPSEPIARPTVGITIGHIMGTPLFSLGTHFSDIELPTLSSASVIKLSLGKLPLLPGTYYLNIGFGSIGNPLMDAVFQAAIFDIVSDGTISIDYKLNPNIHGAFRFQDWHITVEDNAP